MVGGGGGMGVVKKSENCLFFCGRYKWMTLYQSLQKIPAEKGWFQLELIHECVSFFAPKTISKISQLGGEIS